LGSRSIVVIETGDTKGQAKEHRRKQIMDAALAVFSRKGYGEATIPDIAMEAGVAVGTIYHYYKGKHDLLVSLIHTYVMTDPLRELFAQLAEEDNRASVRAIIENGLDWGAEDLRGFLFIFTEVLRNPELGRQFAGQFFAPVLQSLEEYVAKRVSSGAFRRVDQKVAARALVGMILGFLLLKQMEGEQSATKGMPLPELTAEMGDIILEGLQNRGR
jgi:AcrR family transcriptional regulator